MDTHTIIVVVGLSLIAFLTYKVFGAFWDGVNALGDMATGALIALSTHRERVIQEERLFYEYAWTPEEAGVVLQELRRQLAHRINPNSLPELAILDPGARNALLALAVFTRIVPPTAEIRRRIAFLEQKVRQCQDNPPANPRFLSL